jgi:cyclopropane fatty-acyl-phospholipid synthase-like methyltransferase
VTTAAEGTENVNWWVEPAWAQRYLRERDNIPHRAEGVGVLVELLPPSPLRVLDLGTGDGYLMGVVRSERSGVTGVACDFSDEMLDHARARFAATSDIDVVRHDLDEPLPAVWGEFDVVMSSFAIHHVHDERKRALYGEVFAHLVPGGVFFNLEHVASPSPELHLEFLTAIGKTPETDDPSNKLTSVRQQLDWLRDLGFVDVECFWKWRELALLSGTKPTA